MNRIKIIVFTFLMFFILRLSSQQVVRNDSILLGQAFVNLTLTIEYFDSIDLERVSKILAFEENELETIKDTALVGRDGDLFQFSNSLWFLAKAKYLYAINPHPLRTELLEWKNKLDKTTEYFNLARQNRLGNNSFNEFIEYSYESFENQNTQIRDLEIDFTPYFNKDIYPDFKRIFFTAINNRQYYFDSLRYYSNIFDLPIYFNILNEPGLNAHDYSSSNYELAVALDLISRYLQLHYIAHGYEESIDTGLVYNAFDEFVNDLQPEGDMFGQGNWIIEKDDFFKKYLNKKTCRKLYMQLQKKYPYVEVFADSDGDGIADYEEIELENRYFFPTPAPFPTDKVAIKHFKPELKTLKQVDDYIQQSFVEAGYQGRLHYYYIKEPGFAVSTGIERINKDGSPVDGISRWDLTAEDQGLSLYKVFKAMFFKSESNYRMIVCIVSSKEIETTQETMSIQSMSDILKKSYSSLPTDLENNVLVDKTVTILLYHYMQNDVGKVPMLNQNTLYTLYDHLNKTSPLSRLINN